jgi:hypothetical protein
MLSKIIRITLLPWVLYCDRAYKYLMIWTAWLDKCFIWRRVTDDTRLEMYYGVDLLTVLDLLADIKDSKRLRNDEVYRCICEHAAWTNAASEAKRESVRIRFRITALQTQKAFRLECHRVTERLRVVCEAPIDSIKVREKMVKERQKAIEVEREGIDRKRENGWK